MSALNTAAQRTIHAIGGWKALDGVAKTLSRWVEKATGNARVLNAVSGTWLGHQLHPVLTDVPIGAWGAATALDLTQGEEGAAAARRLVGLGVLASAPTALSGASDWSRTVGADRRVGLVHAAANAAAVLLQATSWLCRRRGRHGAGAVLSATALTLTAASAYLGGHLSYARGIGVSHTAFQGAARRWTDVAAVADLEDDSLTRVTVGEVPVVVVKRAGRLSALSAVCTHAGGPLEEGTLDRDGCVTCPWHGSRFRVDDGAVARWPESIPQPSWQVRVDGDRVLLRPR